MENGVLVGIVTAKDFLDASARLFEERLKSKAHDGDAPAVAPEGQATAGGAGAFTTGCE